MDVFEQRAAALERTVGEASTTTPASRRVRSSAQADQRWLHDLTPGGRFTVDVDRHDELSGLRHAIAVGEFYPRGHTGGGGCCLGTSVADARGDVGSDGLRVRCTVTPYGAVDARVPRARDQLTVRVHERVNVRVLELIDESTGSWIELEGNRLPVTHAKDVIDELRR